MTENASPPDRLRQSAGALASSTHEDLLAQVVDSFGGARNPRIREVMTALATHLHAFIRDASVTRAEWSYAIDYLTRTGHKCTESRQEFILLSDVLGASMLIEAINDADMDTEAISSTAATVLGPFHMTASPVRPLGASLEIQSEAEALLVYGQVLNTAGEPSAGALVDAWQADDRGYYDVQQPGMTRGSGRGLFTCDEGGWFYFRTVKPAVYPIPTDGPVGDLLSAAGRHPYRPAHIHFQVTAADHEPLTTHIFMANSDYLDSDAVFAVRPSLVKTPSTQGFEAFSRCFPEDTGRRGLRVDLVLRRCDAQPSDAA